MTDRCGHCGRILSLNPSIATPLFTFYPDAPNLLGLTPGERAVLGELLRARGRSVPAWRLHEALQEQGPAGRPRTLGASSKSLHVTISHTRAKLRAAGFYDEWHKKFGDQAWALLEKYTGKLK